MRLLILIFLFLFNFSAFSQETGNKASLNPTQTHVLQGENSEFKTIDEFFSILHYYAPSAVATITVAEFFALIIKANSELLGREMDKLNIH